MRGASLIVVLLAAGCSSGASPGGGFPPPRPTPSASPDPARGLALLSADPFTNPSSQHRTEVEPDIVASGSAMVAAFQQGRFVNEGASDIGYATSLDGGLTWQSGSLPGITNIEGAGNPFDSVSDPVVAHDAAHAVWLISSLPISHTSNTTPAALVSRSRDGLHWDDPVSVAPGQSSTDKDWIACDEWPASRFYGRCYLEWDEPGANGLVHMSASADGGLTWGPVRNTANRAAGIGGQPVVRPDGIVVVPLNDASQARMLAFSSLDGGATWSGTTTIAAIIDHVPAGGLRGSPLPSAAVDGAGIAYAVWQDCRFIAGCAANDLVMSASPDGARWSAVSRIPLDPPAGNVDHFIPGIAVDRATAGGGAHLALTYFFYPNARCSRTTCRLTAGFSESRDGGATWTAPAAIAGPMSLVSLPRTVLGAMVGDYVATTFAGGLAFMALPVGRAPRGALLDEAMYAPPRGVLEAHATARRSLGDRPVSGARSDHPPRRAPVVIR